MKIVMKAYEEGSLRKAGKHWQYYSKGKWEDLNAVDGFDPELSKAREAKKYYSSDEVKARGMRWVTIRGARVLLQGTADGGYVVVGGAGGKLNHFKVDKILDKEEYERRRKERLKVQEGELFERTKKVETGEAQEFTMMRKKKADRILAQRKKVIRETKEEMVRTFVEHVSTVLGHPTKEGMIDAVLGDGTVEGIRDTIIKDWEDRSGKPRGTKGSGGDFEGIPASVKRVIENTLVKEAKRIADDAVSEAYDRVTREYTGEAVKEVSHAIGEEIVEGYVNTGTEMQLIKAKHKLYELQKELRRKDVDTDTLKVGEAFAGDIDVPEEKIRQEIEQTIETAKNINFYDEINPHMDRVAKYMDQGAARALNGALSDLYEGGSFFNEDLVRELGIEAVSRAIAQKLHMDGKSDTALKALRAFSDSIREKTVDEAMAAADAAYRDRDRILENSKGEEPLYSELQARALSMRHLGLAYNELGSAAGSLRAMAHLINAIEDPPNEVLSIDLGPNEEKALRRMERSGFDKKKFRLRRGDNNHWHAEFRSEELVPFFEKNQQRLEHDNHLDSIKRHEMNDGSQAEGMKSKWGYNPSAKRFEDSIAKAQEAGYRFAKEAPKSLLSFSAGIGKTYISANLLSDAVQNGAKKILVVVPANLKQQTAEDGYKKFCPDDVAGMVKWADDKLSPGKRRAMYNENGIHVISHNALQNDEKWLQKQGFDMVIADEVHQLINAKEADSKVSKDGTEIPGSKSYQSLKKIADKTPRMVAMTGTPIKTNKNEIYKIASLLGKEEELGTMKDFEKRHKDINQTTNAFNASEVDAFRKESSGWGYEQHYDLAVKKNNETFSIKSSPAQRKKYKEIMAKYKVDTEAKIKGAASNRDVDLWRAANLEGGADNPKVKELFRQLDAMPVEDKALVFLSQGPTVSASKEYAANLNKSRGAEFEGIERDGRGRVVVDKRYAVDVSSDTDRNAVIEMKKVVNGKFKDEAEQAALSAKYPNLKVLVATDALATGHNITGATTVFKVDTPLSKAQDDQQTARSYRNGQTRDVRVVYFEGDDPNDINKRYNLRRKGRESELMGNPSSVGVTGDDSGFGAYLRQVEMDMHGVKNGRTIQQTAA